MRLGDDEKDYYRRRHAPPSPSVRQRQPAIAPTDGESAALRRPAAGRRRRRRGGRLLDPRAARRARGARHGAGAQAPCTARCCSPCVMLSLAVFYTAQDAPFLARRAGRRLHRRRDDAVPLRADAGRRRHRGLARRDAAGPARRGRRCSGSGFAVLLVATSPVHSASFHTKGLAGAQADQGNVVGDRGADLHPLRLRLRGRPARCSSRRPRRDGARPPRAASSRGARSASSARARFAAAAPPAPLPGPGVYARHDAVDTPGAAAGRQRRPSVPVAGRACRAGDVLASAPVRRRRSRTSPSDRASRRRRMNPIYYLYLSALLFTIGAAGVLHPPQRDRRVHVRRADAQRRQPRRSSRSPGCNGNLDGQIIAFFVDGRRRRRGRGRARDHRVHLPHPPVGLGRRRQPAEVLRGRR